MHPDHALRSITLVLACIAAACSDDTPEETTPLEPPPSETRTQLPSPTAATRFKGNEVLAADLAQGLALEPSAICNELGTFSCTEEVHAVTLGGTSPYDRQIYEPARRTTATTPLAAERVVLSACLERTRRDLGDPASAVIFTGLPLDGARLADVAAEPVGQAIDRLHVGLLARHASPGEVAAVRAHYAEIEASGDPTPARTWAALSCFAIGSSIEALFY